MSSHPPKRTPPGHHTLWGDKGGHLEQVLASSLPEAPAGPGEVSCCELEVVDAIHLCGPRLFAGRRCHTVARERASRHLRPLPTVDVLRHNKPTLATPKRARVFISTERSGTLTRAQTLEAI